jgi:acyl carrier protein
MSVEAELEAFVLEEIALGRGIPSIGRDEDVLARGIIDSLGVTQLVSFIEERYGIRVTDDDLTPANFRSLRRIGDFIARKLQAAGALP